MRVGIDSYCYHRQFGELYPGLERDPGTRIDIWQFLAHAHALGVDGVSLETCYLPDDLDVARLRAALEAVGLDAVWAWGHPQGLASGARPEAVDDLIGHIGLAAAAGARVMRICAGGRRSRPADWATHRGALLPLLARLVGPAETHGVVLAIENHIDLLAAELVELIETIGSPWLGVCFDTANNLRMGEDPLAVARLLAPHARATHVKNIVRRSGAPGTMAEWPSTALDAGAIDIPAVLAILRGAGYGGLLALEIDYLDPACGEDAEPAIRRSLAFLRGALSA
ncbi:MAG: sugar phosphate isomerase/epimerase [Rhodospirillales bacterium]|nr:sugar phosphate isomerase/epimerase [Rhodospirillales bacterium]MDE2200756.1 sugar phosphate isomerase/epimerase [Rhodospirillales bacterium]MDE2575755.1 sugar phosphate isomerase/epimerase [Rhodospirillales bacterium]